MPTSRTVKGGSRKDFAHPVPHLAEENVRHAFFQEVAKSEPAINEILSEAVYEATGRSGDLLEEGDLSEPDANAYGCGAWGCAFSTLDRRWAIKVSADPREGPTVGAVMNTPALRNMPGCAYILGIWQLPPVTIKVSGYDNTDFVPWIILREDVLPWWTLMQQSGLVDEDGELINEEDRALRSVLRYSKDTGTGFNKAVMAGGVFNDVWEDDWIMSYMEALDILSGADEVRPLADFLRQFYNLSGRVLADVHAGNVGYRINDYTDVATDEFTPEPPTLAVFDLGHSDTAVGADIPFIKNPDIRRLIPVIR